MAVLSVLDPGLAAALPICAAGSVCWFEKPNAFFFIALFILRFVKCFLSPEKHEGTDADHDHP